MSVATSSVSAAMDAARNLASAWLSAWEKPAATAAAKFAADPRTLSVGGSWLSAQLAVQRAILATLDAAFSPTSRSGSSEDRPEISRTSRSGSPFRAPPGEGEGREDSRSLSEDAPAATPPAKAAAPAAATPPAKARPRKDPQ